MHWSSNLDHSRVAGVNPTAVKHWFELLASAFEEYQFIPENVYSFNESGFPFGGDGPKQRVAGRTVWAGNSADTGINEITNI